MAISPGATGQALIYTGSAWAAGTDFGAQNLLTTGALILGAGATTVTTGAIRLSYTNKIVAKNAAGTNEYTVLTAGNGVNNDVIVGEDSRVDVVRLRAISQVSFYVGSTEQMRVASTFVWCFPGIFAFPTGTGTPVIRQDDQTTASLVGQKLSIHAQNCTGATSTGGDLDIGPGSGTTTGGLGRLLSGAGAQRFAWNATGVGLYTTTPVAQAVRVGQATNSTGVTPGAGDRTMADVTTGGLADPAKVNSNFAIIAVNMWNLLETAVHNIGLTA